MSLKTLISIFRNWRSGVRLIRAVYIMLEDKMGSCKKVLKVRRKLTKAKKGIKRKNEVRRVGTTQPDLPLNVPNAYEKSVAAAK